MIKEKKALTLQETKEILGDVKETEKSKKALAFIKKFSKSTLEKAKKLKEEIEKLDIIKLKENDVINVVNFMPENAIELNKIVTETSLDTDETNKILETIKNNS